MVEVRAKVVFCEDTSAEIVEAALNKGLSELPKEVNISQPSFTRTKDDLLMITILYWDYSNDKNILNEGYLQ